MFNLRKVAKFAFYFLLGYNRSDFTTIYEVIMATATRPPGTDSSALERPLPLLVPAHPEATATNSSSCFSYFCSSCTSAGDGESSCCNPCAWICATLASCWSAITSFVMRLLCCFQAETAQRNPTLLQNVKAIMEKWEARNEEGMEVDAEQFEREKIEWRDDIASLPADLRAKIEADVAGSIAENEGHTGTLSAEIMAGCNAKAQKAMNGVGNDLVVRCLRIWVATEEARELLPTVNAFIARWSNVQDQDANSEAVKAEWRRDIETLMSLELASYMYSIFLAVHRSEFPEATEEMGQQTMNKHRDQQFQAVVDKMISSVGDKTILEALRGWKSLKNLN